MKKLLLILFVVGLITFSKTNHVNAQTSCTVTPPTNTGKVTLSADTTAGTYRVWSKMKAADSTNNSFYLQIDSTCPVLVQSNSTAWTWVPNASNVTLTAGTHVVTVIGNQPGVGVDKILMTKNLTCTPVDTATDKSGSNCPAEVIATPTPNVTDTTPPVISNVTVTNITDTTATINWTLNEPASGQVKYGLTSSYGQLSTFQTCCQYSNHIQTLSNLTPGATYHFSVVSADQANNSASSPDSLFKTTGGTITSPTPTPPAATPTLLPATPTPQPNATILRFPVIKLHGIGKGGDNSGLTNVQYPTPLTTQKSVTVEIIDSSGNTVGTANGTIVYNPTLGYYSGDITLPNTIASDSYLIKIKAPKYLRRQVPGIIKITNGTVNQIPSTTIVSLVAGDTNNDNALTLADYATISDCYSDLAPAKNCADPNKKVSADIFEDNKVNVNDYQLFLSELSVVSGD